MISRTNYMVLGIKKLALLDEGTEELRIYLDGSFKYDQRSTSMAIKRCLFHFALLGLFSKKYRKAYKNIKSVLWVGA